MLYSQQKKMLAGKVECDGIPILFLSSMELLEIAKPKAPHCELALFSSTMMMWERLQQIIGVHRVSHRGQIHSGPTG